MASWASVPFLGFVGTEEIFGAAAEAGDVPGKAGFLDRLLYAGGPALGEGIMRSKASWVNTLASVARMARGKARCRQGFPPMPPVVAVFGGCGVREACRRPFA